MEYSKLGTQVRADPKASHVHSGQNGKHGPQPFFCTWLVASVLPLADEETGENLKKMGSHSLNTAPTLDPAPRINGCEVLLLTLRRRPKTVTWPRACSLRCRHSTKLRPLSMGSVTFLLPTVGLTVPASRCGSVCRATSMPLASSSLREPSAPM